MGKIMVKLSVRGAVAVAAVCVAVASCGGSSGNDEGLSDIEEPAAQVVAVLEELGIEHTEPTRGSGGMSGAVASYDMTVGGFDAGINVFDNENDLEEWRGLSDAFGGVHVAFGTSALSLNSNEGIAFSVDVAGDIADAIGGEASGV